MLSPVPVLVLPSLPVLLLVLVLQLALVSVLLSVLRHGLTIMRQLRSRR